MLKGIIGIATRTLPKCEGTIPALLRNLAVLVIVVFSSVTQVQAGNGLVIVVVGAPGTEEYGEQFKTWASRWTDLCEKSQTNCMTIGLETMDGKIADRDLWKSAIETNANASGPLWIVMIGHGTPFGQGAKFNLRGPDVSSDEFAEWIDPVKCRVVVINCTSASGPFMQVLSGQDRIIATATQSRAELNFARFGDYISQAMSNRDADLDHDDQVSLLEAFLTASNNVQRFYDQESRLATEHALLDDNGDKKGTPASFFRGIRATESGKDGGKVDGIVAHQMILLKSDRESKLSSEQVAVRDRLEMALENLREKKSELTTEVYYEQLELIMLQLARIYSDSDDS